MRMVTKLLGIWALGRATSATTPLFLRLSTSIAAIALFSMFLMLLFIMLLGGVLWGLYSQLLVIGIAPMPAKLIIVMILLLLMFGSALFIQYYAGKIRDNIRSIAFARAPVSGRVAHIADAFLRGFTHP